MTEIIEKLETIEKGIETKLKDVEKIEREIDETKKVNSFLKEEIEKMNKKVNEFEVSQKSISIITPEMSGKNLLQEKCKFYRAIFRKDLNALTKFKGIIGDESGSGVIGQVVVPEEFASTVISLITKSSESSIIPFVNTMPMAKATMNVPRVLNSLTAGMVAAGGEIPESQPKSLFDQLIAKKIAAIIYYDNEDLQDATPQLIAKIEEQAAEAFIYRENFAMLSGDGVSDYENCGILGVLNAVDTNVVDMTGDEFSDITVEDLAKLVDTSGISNGTFIAHKTIRSVLRNLSDEGGKIWKPSEKGDVDTIWGYPVIWADNDSEDDPILPALTDSAPETKFFIYGDLKSGIVRGDRLTLEVALDSSLKFNSYQTAIRWVRRVDAIVYGKKFAILKTGAGS
jgi:HK97 family phage major capsid protein